MKEVVAGIDIGGTNTVIGLVDRDGNIPAEKNLLTASYTDVQDFVSAIEKAIFELQKQAGNVMIKGVGIGAPNGNYYKGTVERATNLIWKGIIPLSEMIKSGTSLPVALTNDANAAAVGEMIFGAAKGMKDFIVLTLGTGLGSGIVINGQLVYGHTGFAGELGHIIIVPGGRACGCGCNGCLETYASATGLVRTTLYLMTEMREESSLRNIAPSQLTAKMVSEAAAKNDPIALKAFDFTAEKLAHGIANAVVFSSPQAIFLFGGLANAGDLLFVPVRKYVDKYIMPTFKGTFEVLPSGIKESNAAVLGAAALAWNELT
ncbi:MAG TPA: ROK family protein [Bacteroidales bacterium]|nr:ROK family protein [Bacteroidales bacterium]HCI55696.1 glucokinase [Bacteroidales bacterium]HOU95979.1 ROK family protein [Bacteroidales bacterium]HQG36534.1 ROK family protein [Bacteroidales bacterium]HQG53024.1 ROK family protein [Bacteroidales bacterium]